MTIKNDQSKAFFNQASDANCQRAKEKYSFLNPILFYLEFDKKTFCHFHKKRKVVKNEII